MAWTEEMVETLKKLWDEGVTTGEIGRRLGISKNSIVGKVHRLGLSGRPSPIKKKSETSTAPSSKSAPKAPQEPSKPKSKPETKTPSSVSDTKQAPSSTKAAPTSAATPNVSKPAEKPTEQPTQAKSTVTIIPPLSTENEDIKLAKSYVIPPATPAKKGILSLTELDNHTCRWPIGDPKDDNFHFCGKKIRLGQTYCEEHSAIAYVKPTKK